MAPSTVEGPAERCAVWGSESQGVRERFELVRLILGEPGWDEALDVVVVGVDELFLRGGAELGRHAHEFRAQTLDAFVERLLLLRCQREVRRRVLDELRRQLA